MLSIGQPQIVGAQDGEADEEVILDLPNTLGELGPDGTVPDSLPLFDPNNLSLSDLLSNTETIHPDIPRLIRVDLRSLGPTARELHQAQLDLAGSIETAVKARAQQSLARVRLSLLDASIAQAMAELRLSQEAKVDADNNLTSYAISTFVGFAEIEAATFSLELETMSIVTLSDQSQMHLRETLASAIAADAEVAGELARLGDERTRRRQELVAAAALQADAQEQSAVASQSIEILEPRLENQLMLLPVSGTDIPLVVLDAYYQAAETIAGEQPSCRLSWNQLAGIGKVESRHGTFGGNSVSRYGQISGRILGPVLDGDPFQAIADTDGGALDGDTVWDRAVGPMQFIPTSWQIFGRDGNGDGIRDPHNLYDAALAAGAHLCRSRSGLNSDEAFRGALLGYNRSPVYGTQVMRLAQEYGQRIRL